MRYLHSMVRVKNLEESLAFYEGLLGLELVRRVDVEKGRFSLIYLRAPDDKSAPEDRAGELELTYNWDPQTYTGGRNFGHLAYEVDDIYALCARLQKAGIIINRPPRDGHMAFVRSPDGISIEFLQKGAALSPQEPWVSMANVGEW